MRKEYSRIPFPMIVRACDGDTEAINQILHHYRGYITKRSLRLMKDEYGKLCKRIVKIKLCVLIIQNFM